jgi:hypothetical protein
MEISKNGVPSRVNASKSKQDVDHEVNKPVK